MYYYKKKGKDIIKYQITLDEELLKKLRFEIIEKCSHIIHINNRVTDSMKPFEWDFEHIRNYKEKLIGRIEYNDFYSMPEDEYLVDYDYYEHPSLVTYIDDLLKGDTSSIEKIQKMIDETVDKEKILLEEQQAIIKSLNDINEKDKSKPIKLLNENQEKLLEYYKEKKLNKNQIPASKYKKKVLNCISMEEIEIIPYKAVLEVIKFLCEGNNKTMENDLNKVLKLNL